MTIREMSRITGLTPRTIRFYSQEDVGLLRPTLTGNERKVADYSEDDLLILNAVIILTEAGMELKEIRSLKEQNLLFEDSTLDEALKRLEDKKAQIDGTMNYIKIIRLFGNNKFIVPFFNGLSFKDLQFGKSMVDSLNEAKENLTPAQLSSPFDEQEVDVTNPEVEKGITLGTAIFLLSFRHTIEKPESETTQELLTRLYEYMESNKDIFETEFESENEFAMFMAEMIEDEEMGLAEKLKTTSGEKGIDFLRKAVSIYNIRTQDSTTSPSQ